VLKWIFLPLLNVILLSIKPSFEGPNPSTTQTGENKPQNRNTKPDIEIEYKSIKDNCNDTKTIEKKGVKII
jgi:hypothetical protein